MKKIGLLLWLLVLAVGLQAQQYLDFVENKGQWDKAILYKTETPTGAILLQQEGFRILQYHAGDLDRLSSRFHSHASKDRSEDQSGSKDQLPVPESKDGSVTVRGHAYSVKFINANPNPEIVPDKPLSTISNYFIGNDPAKWASDCKTFQGVTYKSLYNQIDVRFYTADGALKYDIIVHPGGDPSQVIMYFDGVDGLKLKDNALQIKTSLGTVEETIPETYVLQNGSKQALDCRYEVRGRLVYFRMISRYDPSLTLVIDPRQTMLTYSGSREDNWGFTATYDGSGNFYAGGIVLGRGGFPVTSGAFQVNYGGGTASFGSDMGIMKYNLKGERVYATYVGGSGNDQPHSMVVDNAGNLIIAGRTNSSNYPTFGALRTLGPGGDYDIVLTKLNATGTALIGSVKIGGSNKDGVNIDLNYGGALSQAPASTRRNYGDDARSEVILDAGNNILLASVTQSEDFVTTPGAFQRTPGAKRADGRYQDGVLMKFTPTLSGVLFSSLLGGNNDDAPFVLSINPLNGDIYASGATASTDLPGDKTGVLWAVKQGTGNGVDGFIANIKSDGSAIQKLTYIGTDRDDFIFGIQFDKKGFPYITGTTTGLFPVINSRFNTSNPGQSNGRQFIAKLKPDLSAFVFFTNFGNPASNIPSLSLTAFLVDRCENMYVSGWGGSAIAQYVFGSLNGFLLTPDANQKSTDGADFYFFVLGKNADSLIYASYFGQAGGFADHVDGGTSRYSPQGEIYQTICSCARENESSPIRISLVGNPGVWSERRGNQECNMLSVKYSFDAAGVSSGIRPAINGVLGDSTGCVPLTVQFTDTIANAISYFWDFDGDNINDDTTSTPNISHTFNTVGDYRVRLISQDINTCNEQDTSYVTIRVRSDAVSSLRYSYISVPPCGNRVFQFTNLAVAPPGGSFTNTSFEWDFGDGSPKVIRDKSPVNHQFPADGTYLVRLTLKDPSFCNENDYYEAIVRVSSSFEPDFSADTACLGTATDFVYTGSGGQVFEWNFGDGTPVVSTNGDASHTYAAAGVYTVTLRVTDLNTCDVDKTKTFTKDILVSPNPTSLYDYTPRISRPNEIFQFTNLSSGGVRYQWDFGDGIVISTNQRDTTIRHTFNATGTYNVCLYTINAAGCVVRYCEPITAEVNPLFDVPNAFTPNGDGVNDRIYVRGFGIAKMTWRIYNRWGTVVYTSADPLEGWDGKYNGKIQPQGVYHYTVEIEFSDKKKAAKKGDITLLK